VKKIVGNKVIWGIIGVGDVCEKKSAPAMNKIPNSKIKSVMRRNAVKAEDYAKRHHIPFWYCDEEDIFNDPEINAVYIATPPNAHAELTIKAAKAGKAVYVEKPMAANYADCLSMVDACEKANVPLYVAYYRRALPKFLKLRELLHQNAIGEVRMVQIEMYKPVPPDLVSYLERNWRVEPEIAGDGYFYDLASHQLDLMDFLFGPIQKAAGIASNQAHWYRADDIVVGNFSFESGIIGSGSWCFTSGKSAEKELTTIIGSKGQIQYNTFGNNPLILHSDVYGKFEYNYENPEHIEGPMIQLVIEDLLGVGSCPCTGIIGARTNNILEIISNPFKNQ
jgi:predicted dehydrogenase